MRDEGGFQGARGQQGARRLGEQAPDDAARRADGDGGADLAAAVDGGEAVVDVEPDGAVGGEREPVAGGLVDLDVEADAPAGELAADASAAAGREPAPVELLDVEGQRRPAGGGLRVGEHVEHGFRGVRRWSSWPSMSSWPELSRRRVACRRPP